LSESLAPLPPSIAGPSVEHVLPRQSDTELSESLAPLLPITGSSVEHVLPRQSDSEIPVAALNKSVEFNLAESPPASRPSIANTNIDADLPESPAPLPPITGPSVEHVLPRQSDSGIPVDIVATFDQSAESDLAELPRITNTNIEADLPRRSDNELSVPPTTIYESLEPNLNISQVSLLIRSAREPNNKIALKKVKALFKKAARTVRKKLTPEQVYILDNWDSHSSRSRRSSTFSLRSTIYPPSQPTHSSSWSLSPLKIFVDASAFGIGFVFNDRWLAWTFIPNHPNIPLGPDNNIVMSWAELIAVELGILTFLSGRYQAVRVLVMSDNRGVVNALRTRRWSSNHGLDIILARILQLCEEAALELEPCWISTAENPADGPSRGEYPPLDLMLDHSPHIPPHLQELVIQVEVA
jgi:hypothetical protein